MNDQKLWGELESIIVSYRRMVRAELHGRWEKWPIDLEKREMYEVIGALLARQVTFSVDFAGAPEIWNHHLAPVILRAMIDNYINLAWIFGDPLDRSRKFILYGLGQEKLQIEHYKSQLQADGRNEDNDPVVKSRESWINSQRYTFLTEVSIGSWSGIDTRTMANEAGCIDMYNYEYQAYTAASHNMWHHIGKYNLATCPNPLHRHHKAPIAPSSAPDLDYLFEVTNLVGRTFKFFDDKTAVAVDIPSAFDRLVQDIDDLGMTLEKTSDSERPNISHEDDG